MLLLVTILACSGNNTGFSTNPGQVDGPSGDGSAVISPLELVWTDLELGYSYSQELTIESAGTGDLIVYDLRVTTDPADAFFFDDVEDFVLPTGESASFPVVADLEVAEAATGTLRVKTNDLENIEVLIPLTAYPVGYVPPDDTGM